MYDDYSPPSSVSSSTTASSRVRVPHLNIHSSPLSSSSHSHAYAYGQRASKASDIAHLLDPEYSPVRAAYDNQIYVDHAGEAHDPDFRLFSPAGYSPKRRAFLTCDADEDEDVEDEGIAVYSQRRTSPRTSLDSYRPSSRASDPAYHESTYSMFAYTYEDTVADIDTAYFSEDEPRRESRKLRRRREERPVEDAEYLEEAQESTPRSPSPTCSHTIRRQWHALRLRTQVAAFRARRRVTRLVSPASG
ncbi:hypothetical protein K439DRAFT_826401 [Ramaria rubella]|nr:hypothetical protein K439DRAFT_826401 [Ramaria rubella]